MDAAIQVNHVSKGFKVYYDKASSLKETLLFRKRRNHEVHQVLNDVSLTIHKGEAVGLVGRNGCGKSTLLKLITRIIYPDEGSIQVNGRVSSLLELGAGFHPDMSGRENIFTNASIFGMSHQEIAKRVDEIIAFSELEEFIDNPVRTYSSGMYMRLAFAVAINVNADILLIDEILAVGDAAFQNKCLNKLREIRSQGTTIVIVSHSLGQIEQICDRSVWIRDGHIAMDGKPVDVHANYMHYMSGVHGVQQNVQPEPEPQPEPETVKASVEPPEAATEEPIADPASEPVSDPEPAPSPNRWGDGSIHIERVYLCNDQGVETNRFQIGSGMRVCIEYTNPGHRETSEVGLSIERNDGVICYGSNTHIDRVGPLSLKERGKVTIVIPALELLGGEYLLDIAFHDAAGFPYDYWRKLYSFTIFSEMSEAGIAHIPHRWENA